MVLVAFDVFFRLWNLSVVISLGAENKDVCHAVGFVDGVRHLSEDGDEVFDELISVFERENWWELGYILELRSNEIHALFTLGVVCGHILGLGSTSEWT